MTQTHRDSALLNDEWVKEETKKEIFKNPVIKLRLKTKQNS